MSKTWSVTDSLKQRSTEKLELAPEDMALTATAIPIRRSKSELEIMLCNPSPDSWNSWMFPYGSQKFRTEPTTNFAAMTLIDVENFVDELSGATEDQKSERLDGLASMLGTNSCDLKKFETVFEAKISKSSNKLTMYVFEYYYFIINEPLVPEIEFAWIGLGDFAQDPEKAVRDFSTAKSMSVEPNVYEALSSLSKSETLK